MPIYAYRCATCGFAKDALQKMSDAPLTVCPSCGKPEFKKQVTAAGFQLKGSGWYATDFKGGSNVNAANAASAGEGGATSDSNSNNNSDNKSDSKSDSKSDAAPATPAAPAAAATGTTGTTAK